MAHSTTYSSSSRRTVQVRGSDDGNFSDSSGGPRSSRSAMLAAAASSRQQRFHRPSPTEAIARYEATHPPTNRGPLLQLTDDDIVDDWRHLVDNNDNRIDVSSDKRYSRDSPNIVKVNGSSKVNHSSTMSSGSGGGTRGGSGSIGRASSQQQQPESRLRHVTPSGERHVTSTVTSRTAIDEGRRVRSNDDVYERQNGGARYPDSSAGDERDYLFKVQRELEEQRESWRSEVDRLTHSAAAMQMIGDDVDSTQRGGSGRASTSGRNPGGQQPSSFNAETSSYVDTKDRRGPVFKAFVDVSEYLPEDVHVSIDKMTNRVIVEASTEDEYHIDRTFTQRIQLPQFADDAGMTARMNKQGILRIEVPLFYYFPPNERDVERDSRAKSFVYEVRDDPNDPSRQLMEILVNTGRDVSARDLRIEHDGDQLIVLADVLSRQSASGTDRKVIKRYTLPPMTDVDGITSKLGRDGRLTILIPIIKK